MRNNRNYNRDYQSGNFYNSSQRKKRSGAKNGVQKTGKNQGKLYVSAWNYSNSKGMLTVKAFENSKSKKYKGNEKGNRFVMMIFEIFYKNTGNTILELASYNVDSGKVYLEKIGMVISCQAPNGGYFGQIKSK